jgi:nucleotide-binding universal stress UspA family protein
MYQRILVPVDGSATTMRGLAEAITLAQTLKARIGLIHVITDLLALHRPLPGPAVQTLRDQLRSNGECILHDAMATVRAAGVAVDSRSSAVRTVGVACAES